MDYGSSRLVSVREGPNVRQSFDGVRLALDAGVWRVDGFAVRPVETNEGVFDDSSDSERLLWGLYAVAPLPVFPGGKVDLYFLKFDRQEAEFSQGAADEQRSSAGIRVWNRGQPLDYNFEFVFQWGSFGSGDIRAWMVSSDTGYTFRNLPLRPRIGLKADIASGDSNPNDRDLQTFNAMFFKGEYLIEHRCWARPMLKTSILLLKCISTRRHHSAWIGGFSGVKACTTEFTGLPAIPSDQESQAVPATSEALFPQRRSGASTATLRSPAPIPTFLRALFCGKAAPERT